MSFFLGQCLVQLGAGGGGFSVESVPCSVLQSFFAQFSELFASLRELVAQLQDTPCSDETVLCSVE